MSLAAATISLRGRVEASFDRIDAYTDPAVWIARFSREQVLAQIKHDGPLAGLTVAVKDNIDVAGLPTTAACPAFAYQPEKNATVVQKIIDAGAVVVGKTNMDQFATGLVGTRSPHGACRNVFDPKYIAGGSSSGSGVAVAAGLVDFALGTDTAGSGRVPAAFGNVLGVKPTRGLVSTTGVVPACRSLDCVSIFARDYDIAARVLAVTSGFDSTDPFSREISQLPIKSGFTFGVPTELEFFGNDAMRQLYEQAIARATAIGGRRVGIDYGPFLAAAELLYGGPWVAERVAAVRSFYPNHAHALHPVIRQIFDGAAKYSAADAFDGYYRLRQLKRETEPVWQQIDVMVLPTTPTIYTIEQVNADPITLNKNLGHYTNFVNLLDLSALAVPAGFMPGGLPGGVSFIAPAGCDQMLLDLGRRFGGTP
jgi:allophanate hydrolase